MHVAGKFKTAYKSILERIGDPLDDGVLYGPLHNQNAVNEYKVMRDPDQGCEIFN